MAGRQTPEGIFKDAVISELKKLAALRYPLYWYIPHDDTPGVPDIMGCASGLGFAWELKVKGNKESPRQKLFLVEYGCAQGISCSLTKDGDYVQVNKFTYTGRREFAEYPNLPHAIACLLPNVPFTYPERKPLLS